MKDNRDPGTLDLLSPAKRKRGPKPSGKAKSAAQRMREYRRRTVAVNRSVLEAALSGAQVDQFHYDPVGQLEAENDALRHRVQALEAEVAKLRNVTKGRGRK